MSAAALSVADPVFDRTGWWDPACRAFASLRSVSAFRLELLRAWLPGCGRGVVVDLGCGGGLLAVPLAQSGARVLGVDVSPIALREMAAQRVAGVQPVLCGLTAVPLAGACSDLVLLADVLEHLAPGDVAPAVAEAARLLRPGGHLFVNTIARTWRARLLAITLGEGLGYVPRGTHQFERFVQPAELDAAANRAGFVRLHRIGESVRLFATLRRGAIALRRSRDFGVGYAALYRMRTA